FVTARSNGSLVAVMTLLNTLPIDADPTKKYLRLHQLAIPNLTDYFTIGIAGTNFIKSKFPDTILYGVIHKDNINGLKMMKQLGGVEGPNLDESIRPEAKGWITIYYNQ